MSATPGGPTADELLAQRESLRDRGESVTIEELCRDASTEVRTEFQRRLEDVLAAELAFATTLDQRLVSPPGRFTPLGKAGRYADPRPVAEGGMGVLCIALDLELGRPVAYKVMKPGLDQDPVARDRFFHEAEITSRLEHPGIVPVFGRVVDDSGLPAYACGYVSGHTLWSGIERLHALDPADLTAREQERAGLLRSFLTACEVIAYAHNRRVVHGDVKPLNILIDEFEATRLVDWGLARVVPKEEDREGLTTESSRFTGRRLGTRAFMSSPDTPSTFRSDIYALGLTLRLILAENGVDRVEDLRRAPDASPALWAVAQKAMNRARADRYLTALTLGDDVKAVLDDRAITPYRDPWISRLRRWAKHHRTAVASTLIVLAIAAVAGPIAGARERYLRNRAEAERTRTVRLTGEMLDQAELVGRLQATLPASKGLLARAVRLIEQFAQVAEDEGASPGPIAASYYQAGRIYQNLGQGAEAAECFGRSIALAERLFAVEPGNLDNRILLASSLRDWGASRVASGGDLEAIAAWDRAAELLGPVTPGSAEARFVLARTRYARGNRDLLRGDQQRAESAFRDALFLLDDLSRMAPDEPRFLRASADVSANLGMSLQDQAMRGGLLGVERAKLDASKSAYRRALELRRRLARLEPGRPEHLSDVAAALNHLGNVEQSSGAETHADAEAHYREAHAILEALALAYPGSPSNRRELAEVESNLNVLLTKRGRLDEARTLADSAVDLFAKLAADSPDTPDLHSHLGVALSQQAETARLSGRKADADGASFRSALSFARASLRTREPIRRDALVKKSLSLLAALKASGFFRTPEHAAALAAEPAFTSLRMLPGFPQNEP